MKHVGLGVACAALIGLNTTASQACGPSGNEWGAECTEVEFSVVLAADDPISYRLAGELCRPAYGGDTVQILIHGASYNRDYWNFPYLPVWYSYVRRANLAGFATLAIDRLGSGASDRPPGELVSVHASAYTIHQLVAAIRSGTHTDVEGRPISAEDVVLVGHSFGSNISWTEAGIYGDVDAVVLTGISHDPDPPGAPLTQIYAHPAEFDPKFADLILPSGYLTSLPGYRDELFYYVPGASAAVIDKDEELKDTLPIGMLFDQFSTYGLTQNI